MFSQNQKRNKKIKRRLVLILGVLLLIVSLCLISYGIFYNKQKVITERKAIDNYYNVENKEKVQSTKNDKVRQEEYDYIGVLRIPKINLVKGLVDPNSKYNNVEYNVEIIEGSDMPDVDKGHFILAGHSGTGYKAFFNDLNKLEINDVIEVDYKNKEYYYLVNDIKEVNKTGEVEVSKNKDETAITLITCKYKTDKQIVITGYLQ